MTYNDQASQLGLKDVEELYYHWRKLSPLMRIHHGMPASEQEFCDHYRVDLSTLRTWGRAARALRRV